MVKRQLQAPERMESLFETLVAALTSESSSAQQGTDLVAQQRVWERSRCKRLLEDLLTMLLQAEAQARDSQGLSQCLEHALEIGVFDVIAGFGQMDRPAGLLASVLTFYSRILAEVNKELLIPNVAFHRSVKALLLTISENLKKGHVFYRVEDETLDFLYRICERVHRLPLLLEILLVKDPTHADEYLPIPILLYFFKQAKYDTEPRMRTLMHLCVQVDKREVLERLICHTDFASALVFKLVALFKQLPEGVKLRGREAQGGEPQLFIQYCEFLDQLCEKCLWQDLLTSFSLMLHYHFCEKAVFPRLSTQTPTTLYVMITLVSIPIRTNRQFSYSPPRCG